MRVPPPALELRSQILAYTLPYTTPSCKNPNKPYVWHRASIATLFLNRQIYSEAARILYGCNVFVLHVKWDGIFFAYNWQLPSGLTPGTIMKFPGIELTKRNVQLMRRFYIRIKIENEYTGGIKYGFEGLGLAEGVRWQIKNLMSILQGLERVESLWLKLERADWTQVKMDAQEKRSNTGQAILEPLKGLWNTRAVKVEGDVTAEFARDFEQLLGGREWKALEETENGPCGPRKEDLSLRYDLKAELTHVQRPGDGASQW